MVGILLKIGKQSENVGEEEVFGRFCIRDVMENPSGGRISAGYLPSRNRVLPPGRQAKLSVKFASRLIKSNLVIELFISMTNK